MTVPHLSRAAHDSVVFSLCCSFPWELLSGRGGQPRPDTGRDGGPFWCGSSQGYRLRPFAQAKLDATKVRFALAFFLLSCASGPDTIRAASQRRYGRDAKAFFGSLGGPRHRTDRCRRERLAAICDV